MTSEIMWSLLITMAAIAIASVLDSVKHRRELHLSDKELSSTREQLNTIQNNHKKTISDLEQLHLTEKEKLTNRISELEKRIEFHSQKPLKYPGDGGSNSWMG